MTEQAQPLSITINPLKYLKQLPEFNGNYRDIQTFRLRNLNNKTVLSIGSGPAANECAKNNMKTALNIFKEKEPEPMRTILICRNPDSLETAMEILFQSGYAYVTSPNTTFSNHRTPNQEYKNLRIQKHNNRQNNWNPFRQQNSGHNGQPFQRQNSWNPFRQQEIPHTNNFPRPEPMDVNKFEWQTKPTEDENFHYSASGNFHI
ncbi:unnamed protein product [Ceratitis capitata]|uniref:(Mediterranean fruit fly) hypothetical protein n=1 Tax=Ceratitis capitata TaxID=7213 RepID=A0A811UTI7_CERCA|nr:unnamed protein product [Ceratitis capitata]